METEMEVRSGWFQHPSSKSSLGGPEGTDYLIHLLTVQLRRLGPRKKNRLNLSHTAEQGLIWNPGFQFPRSRH